MFVKVTNGEAKPNYTIGDLRKDNPNTSFPKSVSDETLAEYGVFRCTSLPDPDYDPITHRLVTQQPALVDGAWTVSRLAVAKEQAQLDAEASQTEDSVRTKRNKLLAETDYLALSDTTMSAEMTAYRQALRDITAQDGFPHNVTFPTKPE